MTLVDPIGDMLTRIRNGQMRSLNKIEIPFSNFRSKILQKDLQWTWDPKVRHQALNYETWIPKRSDVIFLSNPDMDIKQEFLEDLDLEIQATRDLINKRARDKRALAKQEK